MGLLHLAVYRAVSIANAARPPGSFLTPRTALDAWVPFLGWTSVIYYFGTLYIALWGGIVLWRVRPRFRRAIGVYVAAILSGAAIQLLFPVEAPFPERPSAAQRFVHDFFSVRPYATLPSMHVALSVLPTAMGWSVFRSPVTRAASALAALLIACSTVTTREHYAVDAIAGAALGLGFWAVWRFGGERTGGERRKRR